VRRSVVICIALLVSALAVPAAAHAARLRLVGSAPLTVRGTGFHHGERVRVRLRRFNGRTVVRRVTASSSGAFRLAFPTVSLPCGSWAASAVGSLGSHAFMAGMKFPDCIVR
jgi:hypothetical protein